MESVHSHSREVNDRYGQLLLAHLYILLSNASSSLDQVGPQVWYIDGKLQLSALRVVYYTSRNKVAQ
jgi:hypothetical protein